ncbi:5-oxoprolinase subunit PxpB [Pseudomonas arsenicoxydans]|jgi:5-oxoprolinase (ATP-hydrolysing) subunit B|uniref:Allophanate hydrolase n=1 Tax=Pseudomonas arsenicoxydans TaxID=702115 RepID=A0A4V0YJY2_9PSED|nr:5-oxoprolinase subunit PxpB [Pseudomonas arsenicoxydans]QAY85234.1 allophanate hydrolase [Pseudomonas arsenicoxydans]
MSTAPESPRPHISLLGSTALLFEAPGELDLAPQQRIWSLALKVEEWTEIHEAVPGMNNLMLTFIKPPRDLNGLCERLLEAWEQSSPLPLEGRIVELPVVYGGEFGPHINDVVAHTGLDIETIANLHCEPLYPVYALGSHPGYCYLGGMDSRLATPRRQVPVISIAAGSVSIGGVQTGVSASAGPSGWNTIGRTEMSFFDPTQTPPAMLRPGDMLRLRIERIIR